MTPDVAAVLTPAHVRARRIGRAATWGLMTLSTIPLLPEAWPATAVAAVGAVGFAVVATPRFRSPSHDLGGLLAIALATALVVFTGGFDSPYHVAYLIVLVDDAVSQRLRRLVIDGAATAGALGLIAGLDGGPTQTDLHAAVLRFGAWYLVLVMTHQVTGQLRRTAREVQRSNDLLARSEQRYRSLFDNHPDGVHVRDGEGRLVDANPAALGLLGFGDDATVEDGLHRDLVPAEELERFEAHYRRALAGEAASFETRIRRLDGEVRHIQRTYIPITVDGETVGVFAVSQDITDRVRGEEARRLLASVVESADAGVLSITDGRIRTWNRGAERLFGYRAAEVVGRPIGDFLTDVPAAEIDAMARSLGRGESMSVDTVRHHRDGHPIDVNVIVSPIRNDAGQVVGGSAIVRDISQRLRADAALRASEERFRRLAEHAQGMVYLMDLVPEPRFVFVNPAARTLTGFDADAFYDDPYLPLRRVHPDDRAILHASRRGDRPEATYTYRVQRADGRIVWLEDHATTIHDEDGRPVAVQGIVFDVSAREETQQRLETALVREQEAAERLRQTTEMQAAFLRAISHELRTPLTGVMGFATTLEQRLDDLDRDAVRLLVGRLVANGDRLGRLLDDLLDLNQLARRATEVERTETDLADVCRTVIDEQEPGAHPIAARLEPVVLPLDAGKVERIVDNLVRNARRHTPAGTRITVRTERRGDGGALVVEDEGPGVPDELKLAIFEPFRQGPVAMHAPQPGTGIGLHLVAKLAEVHGGRAWVEDREGGGARFVVWLPRQVEADLTA